ncbi:MAG: hypothetical protein ACK4R6_12455 [Spirosomataceae bacterium]
MQKLFIHITRITQLLLLVVVLVANSLVNHGFSYDMPPCQEQTTEKQAANSSDDESTTVSELSIQSLAPSHAFSFATQVFILPTQQIATWYFSVISYLPSQSSGYISAYFSNIFERLIAINAP